MGCDLGREKEKALAKGGRRRRSELSWKIRRKKIIRVNAIAESRKWVVAGEGPRKETTILRGHSPIEACSRQRL